MYWKYAAGECSRRGSTAPRQAMAGVEPVGKRSRAVSPPARGQDGREADTPGRRDSPRLGPQGQASTKTMPRTRTQPLHPPRGLVPRAGLGSQSPPPLRAQYGAPPAPITPGHPWPQGHSHAPDPDAGTADPPQATLHYRNYSIYILCDLTQHSTIILCRKEEKKGLTIHLLMISLNAAATDRATRTSNLYPPLVED